MNLGWFMYVLLAYAYVKAVPSMAYRWYKCKRYGHEPHNGYCLYCGVKTK